MKNTSFLLLIVVLLLWSCTDNNQSMYGKSSIYPDRIMLNMPGDPATVRAVTWRTSVNNRNSIAQYAVATGFVPDTSEIVTVKGQVTNRHLGVKPYKNHLVVLDGLKPLTRYVYRLGDGKNWSEWIQFKTSSMENDPFSFTYIGDIQNSIRTDCSWVIRQAYSHFPDSHFFLFTGDLVNKTDDTEWQEFYDTGKWIFSSKPSLATPGNHEFMDMGIVKDFSDHWDQFFYFPQNGPEKFKNRIYYTDYQGVRFISIDGYALVNLTKYEELILSWLINVLEHNPNRWTVLMNHYPVYSCTIGRDNPAMRQKLAPILEKYGVDLVLQGHDHTYCRGRNLMGAGSPENSPMYIVSVAGPKANTINPVTWSDKGGSDIQLYQHITFSGDSLLYTSWTANEKLFDSFTMIKSKETGVKTVIEAFSD
jgi:3',5'-cyclic AMP phosphodiesterase CpdA